MLKVRPPLLLLLLYYLLCVVLWKIPRSQKNTAMMAVCRTVSSVILVGTFLDSFRASEFFPEIGRVICSDVFVCTRYFISY